MGHFKTPKFELQIGKTSNRLFIQGVNSIEEASKEAIIYYNKGYTYIFLWGNNSSGKKYITAHNADYLKWNNNKWVKKLINYKRV